MTKQFCDGCGAELERNHVARRYRPERTLPNGTRIQCEIMVAVNGVWNSGDLCLPCIVKTILEGEEKESPEPKPEVACISGKVEAPDALRDGYWVRWGGDASFTDCVER